MYGSNLVPDIPRPAIRQTARDVPDAQRWERGRAPPELPSPRQTLLDHVKRDDDAVRTPIA